MYTQRISNLMFYAKSAGRDSYIRLTCREFSHKDMHRWTSGTKACSCRGQVQRCACRQVKDKVAKVKDKGVHTSRIQKQSKRWGRGGRDFYRLSRKVKHACACNKYTCSTFSWLFVFLVFVCSVFWFVLGAVREKWVLYVQNYKRIIDKL